MRGRLTILFLLAAGTLARGQITDNRRCLDVLPGRPFTDSLTIVPHSLQLADTLTIGVRILPGNKPNTYVVQAPDNRHTVRVCYRVLPAELHRTYRVVEAGRYDSARQAQVARQQGQQPLLTKRQELFDLGGLNQGGSISRGISVGTNQDLFVNSALNLHLDGRISNNLYIRANITDQTLPYQPEGNTQQLQDFDNVYIELYNDKFSLAGGDIILQNHPDSYFLRYRKNVQGGRVRVSSGQSTTSLALSAAKGQFASVWVPVQEGVYGPYKIPPPPAGQSFVIIIANSEKVFLDGRQLTRGYNYDYTIDYNQGEITFTSNVVITNYSRIKIDYEYAVRSFARSSLALSHRQQLGKAALTFNYYREADNSDRPLFTELSSADREVLAAVGNNISGAVAPSARPVPYNTEQILYYLADTLDVANQPVRVYRYATQPYDTVYQVSFSEVPAGQGDYRIKEYLANGRVYEWVGAGNGNFVAWRQLPVANKREMVDMGISLPVGRYATVYTEGAISNSDRNLFSPLDNESNRGFALKTGFRLQDKPVALLPGYKLESAAGIEYLDVDFSPIDRFRRVEFERDWGFVPVDSLPVSDMLLRASFGLQRDAANLLRYRLTYRGREERLQGWQNSLELNKTLGKLQVNSRAFFTDSKVDGRLTTWRKLFAEAFLQGGIQPGYRYILEHNLVKTGSDSILYTANYFATHQVFVRNNPVAATKFELSYSNRQDQTPVAGELQQAAHSNNLRATLNTLIKQNHQVNLVFNYRQFDRLLPGREEVESITGRLDWQGDMIKRVLRSELTYAVANARVPKREYVFVEVPTGQGTHTWRDDNMDGVKDLDEFYEAVYFDERNYIKVYVNTTEFIDAYENRFNYRLTYRPPVVWRQKGGVLGLLGRVSNVTSWTSDYRTTENSLPARLVPFLGSIDEAQVLSLREALRTTFFINKSHPKFGLVAGYALFRKKYLYTNGFEGRDDREYNLTLRWNLTRQYNLKIKSLSAWRNNISDYLTGRNYRVRELKAGPAFSYQPRPTFRLTGSYQVTLKNSHSNSELPAAATINEVLAEVKMGRAARFQFNAMFKYMLINYDGNELSPVGYEMLQGLRPGNNLLWTAGWQQSLLNGLQITFYYEGRKPDGRPVIHSGRAGVRALF